MCKRLSISFVPLHNKSEYQIEDIIRTLSLLKYVIIIDNCKALIHKNAHDFNDFIRKLIEDMQKPKFIVISHQPEDIYCQYLRKT